MSLDHKTIHVNITTGAIIRIILFIILGVLLYKLRSVLFLLLVSIVIATFVDAIARRLKRYRIPRTLSVVSVFLILIIALAAIVYAVVPTLFTEISHALTSLAKYVPQDKLKAIIDPNAIKSIDNFINTIGNQVPATQVASTTKALITNISGAFYGTVQTLFGSVANLVLILVLSFYLSIQEKGIEGFLKLIMPIKYEEYVVDLWNRSARKIALWIRGQMMLAVLMAIITFIVLYFLGVPYALILSLLTMVCELIPFGMIFATIPAVFVGFSSGGLELGLIVLLFYFLLQQLEGYVFVPLMNRRTTGISPLMVILALLIGAQLAGFWGLVLAMPISLFLLELMNDFETKKETLRKLTGTD
jgi:predicted PurR-regulated permease PerM